jgi:hypothetical protein
MRRRNRYAGALDIPAGTSGKVSVEHVTRPAGTTLRSGNIRTAMFGQTADKVTYPEATRWHKLVEDDYGTWMTDDPIEQRQMDELIRTARGGRVLVGGLGLGYAVVALARRPHVTAITVVERSADVIGLVWAATVRRVQEITEGGIMPTLTVVHMDLFEYLRSLPATTAKGKRLPFTWALYDIWQADGETTFHTTVVPLRKASVGRARTVVCWNEDVMRGQLFQGLTSRRFYLTPEVQEQFKGQAPTLEQLCTVRENKWHDWAVPFWCWYRDYAHTLQPTTVDWIMARYVVDYGRPDRPVYLPTTVPRWVEEDVKRDREHARREQEAAAAVALMADAVADAEATQ